MHPTSPHLLRALGCALFTSVATIFAVPPTITQQPGVAVVTSGSSATFSVVATASGSLSYQWRHLGTPLANATGPTLTLSNVTMADAGLYDVVVTSGGESTTSQAGRLITTPTQYADQFCLDDSFLPLIETTGALAEIVAADPITGGFYVGGEFSTIDGARRWNLARFDSAGNIDATFTPQVDGKVLTIAVQPDGKVLIGGAFHFVNNVQRGGIARLNTDGTLDRTFGNNRGFDGTVTCIGLQSTGRIIVSGPTSYDNLSKLQYTSFLRLLPDGTVDNGFSASASPQSPWFVIDRQDRILFRGYSWDGSLVRLTANGVKDTTFNAPIGLGAIYSLAVQQDGRPVLVGDGFVQRLQADGSIDAGFNISGFSVSLGEVPAVIAVDATDNTLINCDSRLLRVDPDGVLESSFGVSLDMQRSITVLPGGRIAAVGRTPVGVKLLNSNGTPERFATAVFFKLSSAVTTTIPAANGTTLIAGDFARVDGLPRSGIARLLKNGTVDPSFTPPASAEPIEAAVCQGDGRVLAIRANDFAPVERLLDDGSIDPIFTAQPVFLNSFLRTARLAIQADGKVLVGGNRFIKRLETDGADDLGFAPVPKTTPGVVQTILPLADGRILCGGISLWSWENTLSCLLSDGVPDPTFQSLATRDLDFRTCWQRPDGSLVAGGKFGNFGSTLANNIVWLDSDGSLARGGDWDQMGSGLVSSILWQTDERTVVSGTFTRDCGITEDALLRLNADGTRDTTFLVANAKPTTASTAQFDDTGRILYSGASASRCGLVQTGLARLKPGAAPEPQIIQSPTNAHFLPGITAVLQVQATGTNLRYTWFKDGQAIANSDTPTFSIPAAASTDSGRYHVEASNTYGAVLSSGADLVITTESQIEYYEWANANGLTDPHSSDGSQESDPEGDGTANLLHYAFNTPRGACNAGSVTTQVVSASGTNYLAITFPRKTYAVDLRYVVEASSDLENWETISTLTPDTPAMVTVRDTTPCNGTARRFLRVRVDYLRPF